jgi:hypothetical protein
MKEGIQGICSLATIIGTSSNMPIGIVVDLSAIEVKPQ